MNLSHATALVLVGWYLIVPPVRVHDGQRGPELGPVPSAPRSEWWKSKMIGSRAECQQKLDRMLYQSYHDPIPAEVAAGEAAIRLPECVSTDDPRLKGTK
jgi:hypothetical protein